MGLNQAPFCLLILCCLAATVAVGAAQEVGPLQIAAISPKEGPFGSLSLVITVDLAEDPFNGQLNLKLQTSDLQAGVLVAPKEAVSASCRFDTMVLPGEYVPPVGGTPARILCRTPVSLDVGAVPVRVSVDGGRSFSVNEELFTTLLQMPSEDMHEDGAASRHLLSTLSRLVDDADLTGLPVAGRGRVLVGSTPTPTSMATVSSTPRPTESFYGVDSATFYGHSRRKTRQNANSDEVAVRSQKELLVGGLGSKPSAKDFDVCVFGITPPSGPPGSQVTLGLAGAIPAEHNRFYCKFNDLVFRATSVKHPDNDEGPTFVTCQVPPLPQVDGVSIRISADGFKFSATGPRFTLTDAPAATGVPLTNIAFSIDNCIFYDAKNDGPKDSPEEDEMAREERAIGDGVSGHFAGSEQIHQPQGGLFGSATKVAGRVAGWARSLVDRQTGVIAAEVEAEEQAIGEGVSGRSDKGTGDAASSERRQWQEEEEAVGEGLSGATGAITSAAVEAAEEERMVGEGLSGHTAYLARGEVRQVAEIEADARAIGEGLSGHATGLTREDSREASREEVAVGEGVSGHTSGLRVEESEEATREEADIGEGLSGSATELVTTAAQFRSEAEEVARRVREGVSGSAERLRGGESADVADDVAAEEAAVGEGLSGAVGRAGAPAEDKDGMAAEVVAEEKRVGEGASGHEEALKGEEEVAREEHLVGEGLSGHMDRTEGKGAGKLSAGQVQELAVRSIERTLAAGETGKGLRLAEEYGRIYGGEREPDICAGSAATAYLKETVILQTLAQDRRSPLQQQLLEVATCSLARLTRVPAEVTVGSSDSVLQWVDTRLTAMMTPIGQHLEVATAKCMVDLINDLVLAEAARDTCQHIRSQARLEALVGLPGRIGQAVLRWQHVGMSGITVRTSNLTLVAAKVGGGSDVHPRFTARTGPATCSVVVSDPRLPVGGEFDAIMYTYLGVALLPQATDRGSVSAVLVKYGETDLDGSVIVEGATGSVLQKHVYGGLNLYPEDAFSRPFLLPSWATGFYSTLDWLPGVGSSLPTQIRGRPARDAGGAWSELPEFQAVVHWLLPLAISAVLIAWLVNNVETRALDRQRAVLPPSATLLKASVRSSDVPV